MSEKQKILDGLCLKRAKNIAVFQIVTLHEQKNIKACTNMSELRKEQKREEREKYVFTQFGEFMYEFMCVGIYSISKKYFAS